MRKPWIAAGISHNSLLCFCLFWLRLWDKLVSLGSVVKNHWCRRLHSGCGSWLLDISLLQACGTIEVGNWVRLRETHYQNLVRARISHHQIITFFFSPLSILKYWSLLRGAPSVIKRTVGSWFTRNDSLQRETHVFVWEMRNCHEWICSTLN